MTRKLAALLTVAVGGVAAVEIVEWTGLSGIEGYLALLLSGLPFVILAASIRLGLLPFDPDLIERSGR